MATSKKKLHGDDGKRGSLSALGHRGKDWKTRYFVIKDNFLHYFKKQDDQKPDGVIPLEGCTCQLVPRSKKVDRDNSFELVACNRSYVLHADKKAESEDWCEKLMRASRMTIRDLYDIKKVLGEGTFSKVKLGVLRKTGVPYALKVIDKNTLAENREALLTEISILKQVNHPNVICMLEIFETRKKLYLVMDVLTGGELFDRIVQKGTFSEADAAALAKKIVGATQYIHNLGIVHRDLKPENLLYATPDDNSEIKLADFGLSKFVGPTDLLRTACGTPGYVAPEVLELTGYNKEVDLWSIGVILYILLCGFPPFYAENDNDMFVLIKAASFDFPEPYWDDISQEARDLVTRLLTKDPKKRYTAEQTLKHPWMSNAKSTQNERMVETLKAFNAKGAFRRGVGKLIMVNRFSGGNSSTSAA